MGGERKPATRRRQARAALHIRQHGSLSRAEYAALVALADSTAKEELREMVDGGVLVIEGAGKRSVYVLNPHIPLF